MLNTVILLSPFERCSNQELLKHMTYLNPNVPFDVGFYQPLKQVFSRVILYDYIKRMVEVGVKGVNREIIDLVKKERPQYALWVALGSYYEIQETTFNAIRAAGTKVIGWFFDDNTRFDTYSKWWAPYIDYFVTNDLAAVTKYQELGTWATQAICTGYPCDRPKDEKYGVSFVGTKFADREQYIKTLNRNGIHVDLFGAGFGKFVPYAEMMNIFSVSKVNLNFAKSDENGIKNPTIKARIFEVCLAGGFLLTEYFPGIEDYFEIDREIACFRNPEEMIDKIAYYLNHDEQRRAIAQAGWKRATNEYTSFHMMSRVFREIEEAKGRESKPKQLGMPKKILARVSNFYCDWGIAFSMVNHRSLSRDALLLSASYYPFNARAWYHYIISFLPHSLRLHVISFCRRALKIIGRDDLISQSCK